MKSPGGDAVKPRAAILRAPTPAEPASRHPAGNHRVLPSQLSHSKGQQHGKNRCRNCERPKAEPRRAVHRTVLPHALTGAGQARAHVSLPSCSHSRVKASATPQRAALAADASRIRCFLQSRTPSFRLGPWDTGTNPAERSGERP